MTRWAETFSSRRSRTRSPTTLRCGPPSSAMIAICTGMLGEIAGACILVGAAADRGRDGSPVRPESPAPGARRSPRSCATSRWRRYGSRWPSMVLIFIWQPIPATGKPAGIIVFTVLALVGTYVLRRQTTEEFPDARPGAAAQSSAPVGTSSASGATSPGPPPPRSAARSPSSSDSSPNCATTGRSLPTNTRPQRTSCCMINGRRALCGRRPG